MHPKFIQIMSAGTGAYTGGDVNLFGLTADGRVFEWTQVVGSDWRWVELGFLEKADEAGTRRS